MCTHTSVWIIKFISALFIIHKTGNRHSSVHRWRMDKQTMVLMWFNTAQQHRKDWLHDVCIDGGETQICSKEHQGPDTDAYTVCFHYMMLKNWQINGERIQNSHFLKKLGPKLGWDIALGNGNDLHLITVLVRWVYTFIRTLNMSLRSVHSLWTFYLRKKKILKKNTLKHGLAHGPYDSWA